MNRITITGRLTRDPELRELETGAPVCQLRLAVDGLARGNETGYVDVATFGRAAQACQDILRTGWLVAVDGRLEHRTYDRDGETRHAHQVVGNVEFLAAPRTTQQQTAATAA